jgi:hypothetical protein
MTREKSDQLNSNLGNAGATFFPKDAVLSKIGEETERAV